MEAKRLSVCCLSGMVALALSAQKVEVRSPDVISLTYLGQTVPLRDYVEDPFAVNEIVRGEKLGAQPKHDWHLHPKLDPRARPLGIDPALQTIYNTTPGQRAVLFNYEGMGYTNVNPPDPTLDVGPDHVIQMINAGSGATFQIWDKNGNSLIGPLLFDNFFGVPDGAGDPIVLYDQLADRWFMSEFANTGNHLHIAISATSDPLGSWYTYIFDTPDFPDYPKYAVWPDAYYVTTNESDPTVYALDRTKMLAGDSTATAQRFTIPSVPTLSFQTATPVDLEGQVLPPPNTPGYIMRMVDDGWSVSITEDYLEIWEFHVDFNIPANSSLTGPDTLHTLPFDSELCGYTSFSCIEQPHPPGHPPDLDPLREVLMNRVHYRNFGTYETIVCNHVTDVDGADRAGVRWYELRKTSDWSVYQQGTYSPDTDSRWMAAIAIDHEGNIGLAYNVSSTSTYPSLRFTGRAQCDPLGMMTVPETVIAAGADVNQSSRYGDYSTMSVDPVSEKFWFTGEYNPANQWSTRIVAFDPSTCIPSVSFVDRVTMAAEANADMDSACLGFKDYSVLMKVAIAPSQPATASFTVISETGTTGNAGDYVIFPSALALSSTHMVDSFTVRVFDDAYVEGKDTLILGYTLNANGGDAVQGFFNQTHMLVILDDDIPPVISTVDEILSATFEGGAEGFTSDNSGTGDDWTRGTSAQASSNAWTVPDNGSSQIFFVNDDECNCDMEDVKLITPVIDLTNSMSSAITFNSYFLGKTYQDITETAELQVSVDSGSFSPIAQLVGSPGWQTLNYDLSAYDGESNIRVAFRYGDHTGWLYGWAIDNVVVTGRGPAPAQTDADTLTPPEAYLGPYETVHFYDPATGNIVATIANTSAADFGCTTVAIDRQGTIPSAVPFMDNSPSTYLHSKTFKVIPEHQVEGTYDITLYYTAAEIEAWSLATGNIAEDASIIKVSGSNSIADVTPLNYESFTINAGTTSVADYGDDTTFTASFSGGFSGFGVGRYCKLRVKNTSDAAEESLRAVLACARDGDTVRFDAGLFNDTISLTSGPLIIGADIVLFSSLAEHITIDGSNLLNAIQVDASANAEIIGMTILSGTAAIGRGIHNFGTLTIDDVTVIDHPSAGAGEVVTNEGTIQVKGSGTVDE